MVRDAYNSGEDDASVFGDFVKIGKSLMRDHPGYRVKWVCRKANGLAHAFARATRDFESL